MSDSIETGRVAQGPPHRAGVSGTPSCRPRLEEPRFGRVGDGAGPVRRTLRQAPPASSEVAHE